jgi:hypothetical protein
VGVSLEEMWASTWGDVGVSLEEMWASTWGDVGVSPGEIWTFHWRVVLVNVIPKEMKSWSFQPRAHSSLK